MNFVVEWHQTYRNLQVLIRNVDKDGKFPFVCGNFPFQGAQLSGKFPVGKLPLLDHSLPIKTVYLNNAGGIALRNIIF